MVEGKCIIFSAPSGSGKTTLVRNLLQQDLDLEFSISACSRAARGEEKNGEDYYFLSIDEFKDHIQKNDFIEWEEVYPDHFYGTLKSEIHRIWEKKKSVIFDVDVIGGLNLKKYFGTAAMAIFVQPPNMKTLEERLRGRKTDSEERIIKRLEKAKDELKTAEQFDCIILNDNLNSAKEESYHLVKKFLETKEE